MGNFDWKVHFLDFDQKLLNRVYVNSDWLPMEEAEAQMELDKPVMTYVKFNVEKVSAMERSSKVADAVFRKGVYLMLPKEAWSKGSVFVNNFNLGRYWSSVGPLCTLFVPEFVLFEGANEIMIFEMHKSSRDPMIYLTSSHVKILY